MAGRHSVGGGGGTWVASSPGRASVTIAAGGSGGGGGGTVFVTEYGDPVKAWYEQHEHIKTDRLLLLQVEPTHEFITVYAQNAFGSVVNWLNDVTLMRYSEQRHQHHTIHKQNAYVLDTFGGKNLMKGTPSKYWLIYKFGEEAPRPVDKLIGTITGHTDAKTGQREVDIGILLGQCHGNGYAAEAMNLVINHYYNRGVTRFTCGMHHENEAMQKLASTVGMKLWRFGEDHIYMDMDLPPLPPAENKPVKHYSKKKKDILNVLDEMQARKEKSQEEKKSLLQQMKDTFYDSSKWTGR